MKFKWFYSSNKLDWDELANYIKLHSLGDKKLKDLKVVLPNSKYKCFVYDNDKLIGVGQKCG